MKFIKDNNMLLFISITVVLFLAAFFLSQIQTYIIKQEIDAMIKSFKNGHPLICSRTAFDTKYLISEEKGWHLLGNNVTNGEKVYKLEKCDKGV